jgi:ParB family chromosome partitioning protein
MKALLMQEHRSRRTASITAEAVFGQALREIRKDRGLTQEEVAKRVGKDRSTIANHLRLLKLPEKIQNMISDGLIDGGHARAILALPDERQQIEAAEKVVSGLLTVRETEELVRSRTKPRPEGSGSAPAPRDPNVIAAEERLTKSLGSRVRVISSKKKGAGKTGIDYYSEDELDRLFSLLVARSH